jgi:hypothetical protein
MIAPYNQRGFVHWLVSLLSPQRMFDVYVLTSRGGAQAMLAEDCFSNFVNIEPLNECTFEDFGFKIRFTWSMLSSIEKNRYSCVVSSWTKRSPNTEMEVLCCLGFLPK